MNSMKKLPPEPVFRILHPYDGTMTGEVARRWVADLIEDGEVLGDEVDRADPHACAEFLHFQGHITIKGRPDSND